MINKDNFCIVLFTDTETVLRVSACLNIPTVGLMKQFFNDLETLTDIENIEDIRVSTLSYKTFKERFSHKKEFLEEIEKTVVDLEKEIIDKFTKSK